LKILNQHPKHPEKQEYPKPLLLDVAEENVKFSWVLFGIISND
jgi:hypothetical protein